MNWKEYISQDTLDWLLEESNPSVRYFTLTNILDRQETDIDIIEAKKQVNEKDPVKKIFSHQNPDGSFLTDTMIKKYGKVRAKSGYLPKYKATIWQAIFLAQLGADKNDERLKKLCKYILDNNYSEKYKTIGSYMQMKGSILFFIMPCYIANMVWVLSKFGFYKDQRIQNSIKWILTYQRFDDGDFNTPNEWPYRGKKDRCFGKHSCYVGCTQALKAMTVVPKDKRNEEVDKFITKGIKFILLHKVYKKSRTKNELIRKEYELLRFPFAASDDILGILETLLYFKIKDKPIDDAIKFILSKRNANGKWCLEYTISRSAIYTKFEDKEKESKWITYRAINVLKKYYEVLNNQ